MSTEYILARQIGQYSYDDSVVTTELSVVEHSSLLDIDIDEVDENNHGGSHTRLSIKDLPAERVRRIAISMLESASYASEDPEEFMKEAAKMMNNSYNNFPIEEIKK